MGVELSATVLKGTVQEIRFLIPILNLYEIF
jgi:hypothetical protein